MQSSLASAVTKAASKQTYYTIRFLVDRERREDAYRAYAYFRWVDDILDGEAPSNLVVGDARRRWFVERQRCLLDRCLRGEAPLHANLHEAMLVELVEHAGPGDGALEAYLRNMMRVMDFDVRRRGQLISQAELNAYTGWLATAVTEAMDHFLGEGADTPRDETRYLAVTGAHIVHMLRDTCEDLQNGYFNVPREVLEASSIGPADIQSNAYRAWVADRVKLARTGFEGGRDYFARVGAPRHRLAGLAYMARFEWLMETLEREGYRLRPRYEERRSLGIGLLMGWQAISGMVRLGHHDAPSPVGAPHGGRR
jgi:phytoene/squalene synthetase